MHELDKEISPVYVKWGLDSYGPDLDEDEPAITTLREMLEAIAGELDYAEVNAIEEAAASARVGDYEQAYKARVLADELEAAALNIKPSRFETAPLYREMPGHLLSKQVWLAAAQATTQRLSLSGNGRIFIMDADQ